MFAKPLLKTFWFWSGTASAILSTTVATSILLRSPENSFFLRLFGLGIASLWIWREWIEAIKAYRDIYSKIALLRETDPTAWQQALAATDLSLKLSSASFGFALGRSLELGVSRHSPEGGELWTQTGYTVEFLRTETKRLSRLAYVPSGIFILASRGATL